VDLLIPLDRGSSRPLRDQVYDELRAAILDGRIPAGGRLPSTRSLAIGLGVARFTVEDAFGRLAAVGYTVGRHGSGTIAASTGVTRTDGGGVLPGALPSPAGDRASPRRGAARCRSPWAEELARVNIPVVLPPAQPFDFRQGMPALDVFPHARWARVRAREARRLGPASYHYGPVAGEPELREAIAAYLARSRAVRRGFDHVVVTSGAQQGLDLLARLWLRPGDLVAMEDPGYPAARRVFAAAGARIVPVPVDGDGFCVDALDAVAGGERPRLIYVTPSHQYPTGAVLSLPRRLALLGWARRNDALVVEDDYDAEFRFGARPVEALAGLDAALPGEGVVAYVGTFSKVLYPALRLGYLVVPPDLVAPVVAAKAVTDRHGPRLEQRTVAAFMAGGDFERHLGRMRRLYAARRDALVDALVRDLAGIARRNPGTAAAGLHLLVGFEVPFEESELVARAAAAGVHVDGAGSCYDRPPTSPLAMLGYAALPEPAIREGIARLAIAIRGDRQR
jgi:GntR family transcriptional regulator/MocR family aminotransferase